MTSKQIKYSALEGLSEITSGSLLNFNLPPYGLYDIENSYLAFNCNIDEQNINDFGAIHMPIVSYSYNETFPNAVLIKDYEIRSSKVGILESVLDSDVVCANLEAYSRDWEQITSENYQTLTSFYEPVSNTYLIDKGTQFRRLFQDGRQSYKITHEVKIPLSSFSPMMSQLGVWNGQSMGETRLNLKFDSSKLDVLEVNFHQEPANSYNCDDIGALADTKDVILSRMFNANEPIPLQIGNRVQVFYTSGGKVAKKTALIENVAFAAGVITVTLDLADNNKIPKSSTNVKLVKIFGPVAENPPITCQSYNANDTFIKLAAKASNNEKFNQLKQKYTNRFILITGQFDGPNQYYAIKKVVSVSQFLIEGIITVQLNLDSLVLDANLTNVEIFMAENCLSEVNGGIVPNGALVNQYKIKNSKTKDLYLWTNQAVQISGYTAADTPGPNFITTIKSLSDFGGDVIVELATNPPALFTENIFITTLPNETGRPFKLKFSNPQIALKMLMPNHPMSKKYNMGVGKFEYTTYSIERANNLMNQRQYNRQFDCAPNCVTGMFLVVDKRNTAKPETYSTYKTSTSVRLRLNDILLGIRDIKPNTSEYHDTLVSYATNSKLLKALKNLGVNADTYQNNVIPQGSQGMKYGKLFTPVILLPPTQDMNRVTIQLNQDVPDPLVNQGYTDIYFVKEEAHMLEVSSNRAVLY